MFDIIKQDLDINQPDIKTWNYAKKLKWYDAARVSPNKLKLFICDLGWNKIELATWRWSNFPWVKLPRFLSKNIVKCFYTLFQDYNYLQIIYEEILKWIEGSE